MFEIGWYISFNESVHPPYYGPFVRLFLLTFVCLYIYPPFIPINMVSDTSLPMTNTPQNIRHRPVNTAVIMHKDSVICHGVLFILGVVQFFVHALIRCYLHRQVHLKYDRFSTLLLAQSFIHFPLCCNVLSRAFKLMHNCILTLSVTNFSIRRPSLFGTCGVIEIILQVQRQTF